MTPLTNYVHRSPKKILGSPLKFNFLLRYFLQCIMQVTVSVAIMQLEVSAVHIEVIVSATNMWMTIFIVIMQVGISVTTMQVVFSAVHYPHDCFK